MALCLRVASLYDENKTSWLILPLHRESHASSSHPFASTQLVGASKTRALLVPHVDANSEIALSMVTLET